MDLNYSTFSRLGAGPWRALRRGVSEPDTAVGVISSYVDTVRTWNARVRWFILTVIVPTLCVAAYYFVFAADQYVSEARFLIRGPQGQSPSFLGQMLGSVGLRETGDEANGVAAYLVSHDAADTLQKKVDLVGVFRKNGLDFLDRTAASPSHEALLKHYSRHVHVSIDTNTGIVTLQVRTFRPEDSNKVAEALLEQSEALVNQFSARAEADALRVARSEVDRAEQRLTDIGRQLTQFRTAKQSMDPTRSSTLTLQEISEFDTQLGIESAKLAQMRAVLKPGTPELQQEETKVASLQATLSQHQADLVGGGASMAPVLGDYERLSLQQDLASKDYASAVASLQAAKLDAQRQHLYLVRIVEPNLPDRPTFPNRWLAVLTVFVSLCVAYGIGWLIVAGVHEHAA
jgi:capsular polysaccharide transport system permease protein